MTQCKNVYMALAAAQSEMGPVVKGSVNPAFKSKYADLADLVNAIREPLNRNGLCFFHKTVVGDQTYMRTVLMHGESETSIDCDVPLIVAKNDMQGMKSATTYAKRIGLESLTGVAPEDDDGNAASKSPPKEEPRTDKAIPAAVEYLNGATSLDDLKARWNNIPTAAKAAPLVVAAKDARKAELDKAPADDLAGDLIPY